MGKRGGSKHLKRKPAPAFWPIRRKEFRWIIKPGLGSHSSSESLPLAVVLRDILHVASSRREVDIILSNENVEVDGVVRHEDDFPIGIMDVVNIRLLKKAYRVLPFPRRGLRLHSINLDENDFKLCKITGKTTIKGGHIQLNLHDGRNHIVKILNPSNPVEDIYKTNDLLKIGIPTQEIISHLKFEPGVFALVEKGSNMGRWGEVVKIGEKNIYDSAAFLKANDGKEFETIVDYLFPIGKGELWISLPNGESE